MSQYIPSATGVNFNGNAGSPDAYPSQTALTTFRASIAALSTFASTASAADISTAILALIGAEQGAHAAAIAQLWTAQAQAVAGNAAGARTTITAAVATAATAPSAPAPGVQF